MNVRIADKLIINNLSLTIKPGEIHVIMGRNGSGKSTLVNALMGHPSYQVTGEMKFKHQLLNDLSTNERAALGMYLCLQNPPVIEGVSTADLMRTILSKREGFKLFDFINDMETKATNLGLKPEMLHRSVNDGFSGGERKKNDILQLQLINPKLIILDEIDSGVDIDSLKDLALVIKDYLTKNPDASLLMITHHNRLFKYLTPTQVHIMNDGQIIKTGDQTLATEIEHSGFEKTVKCALKEMMTHE